MRFSTRLLLIAGSLVGIAAFLVPTITKAEPSIIHPDNSQTYNENPPPRLVGNVELPTANFIPKEKIVGTIPSNARLISSDLVTWRGHVHKTLHDQVVFNEVSPDRMVWVVTVAYPDGLSTRGGFFVNAVRTEVFDAQTGEFISATTTGDSKRGGGPLPLPQGVIPGR